MLSQAPPPSQPSAEWQLPDLPEWHPAKTKPAAIYEPVRSAYKDFSWSDDTLWRIGKAMQIWPHDGQRYDIGVSQLKDHLQTCPLWPGPSKKPKAGLPRWTGPAIFTVARLVKRRRSDLLHALQLDAPEEKLLSHKEQIDLLLEENSVLKAEAKAAALIKDRYRKLKERLADQRAGAAERLRHKIQTIKAEARAKVKEAKAVNAEKADAKAEAKMEAKYESQLTKEKAKTSKARARARDAEATANKVPKLQERALQAEMDKTVLRETIDELHEELEATEPKPDPRLALMPRWQPVRPQGRGGKMLEWGHRVCIWEQLANQTRHRPEHRVGGQAHCRCSGSSSRRAGRRRRTSTSARWTS